MMLDNAFGIFNNVPPRIQWSEIDLPFPSDDACFKAANYSELLSIQRFPVPRIKIKSAFVLLFGPTDSIDTERALQSAALTVLDLQMLIHSKQPFPFGPHFARLVPLPLPIKYLIPPLFSIVLYTHIWAQTFSNPLAPLPATSISSILLPFKTALENWKRVWDNVKSNSGPESEWMKIGFHRQAERYFDAVVSVVRVWERREGRFPNIKGDCEKGEHLRRLLSF